MMLLYLYQVDQVEQEVGPGGDPDLDPHASPGHPAPPPPPSRLSPGRTV